MADDVEENATDQGEITADTVAESLGMSDEQEEEGNGEDNENENENDDGEGGAEENEGSGEDEEGGDDEEADPDAQAASGGKDGEGTEGGEEEEIDFTPEHQVGAGIQKFLADNIPAERVAESMGHFQNAMGVISDQMNGDYKGYWDKLTPSLEQAAIDNPDVFIDTLAPLYEKVLYGEGRLLTPENRQRVKNMEISEELALNMQKNDHKLSVSQRSIDMFKNQNDSAAQNGEIERQDAEAVLAVRETLEKLEGEHPGVKGAREHIMKELADVVPESADHARLIVENAFLKMVNDNSQKNGQRGKKPLRSNKKPASSAPTDNPDAPHTADEVAKALDVA